MQVVRITTREKNMSTTHTLPSGATVVLRDPATVTERQNRQIVKAQVRLMASSPEFAALVSDKSLQASDTDTPEDIAARGAKLMAALGEAGYEAAEEINDALIAVLVESWSYPNPPSADAAADLPRDDYAELKEITAEAGKALLVKDGSAPNPDPESPTQP